MTDDDLDIPERFDSESFRAGYAQAMQHIGQTALAGAADIRSTDPGETDDEDDEGPDGVCPDCGAETLASMGAPEDVTPAGRCCPNCEL